jgi:hypothetical protein
MQTEPDTPPSNWAAELRDLVNRVFDTNDLHELSFDLGIDYDGIAGDSRSRKVVELLQILSRQRRLPEFIERCQALRPMEKWQPLLDASRSEALAFYLGDDLPAKTAVSAPAPSAPTNAAALLKNKGIWVGTAVALLVLIAFLWWNSPGGTLPPDFGDPVLFTKIESLVTAPRPERELILDENYTGWNLTSQRAAVFDDGNFILGPQSDLLRDTSFGPGQGILLDFELSEVNSQVPVVTFSLQNNPDRSQATRTVSLLALRQPDSVAIADGEQSAPAQFSRNLSLAADELYTVMLALDANGRFVITIFNVHGVEADAMFIHRQPPEWAQDSWRLNIQTGDTGSLMLLGGWEFTFDDIK